MAKNKNRKQQQRSSVERGSDQQPRSAPAPEPEQMQSPVTPAEIAHKGRQKRFGHN